MRCSGPWALGSRRSEWVGWECVRSRDDNRQGTRAPPWDTCGTEHVWGHLPGSGGDACRDYDMLWSGVYPGGGCREPVAGTCAVARIFHRSPCPQGCVLHEQSTRERDSASARLCSRAPTHACVCAHFYPKVQGCHTGHGGRWLLVCALVRLVPGPLALYPAASAPCLGFGSTSRYECPVPPRSFTMKALFLNCRN